MKDIEPLKHLCSVRLPTLETQHSPTNLDWVVHADVVDVHVEHPDNISSDLERPLASDEIPLPHFFFEHTAPSDLYLLTDIIRSLRYPLHQFR
jgi:hypothetical protein